MATEQSVKDFLDELTKQAEKFLSDAELAGPASTLGDYIKLSVNADLSGYPSAVQEAPNILIRCHTVRDALDRNDAPLTGYEMILLTDALRRTAWEAIAKPALAKVKKQSEDGLKGNHETYGTPEERKRRYDDWQASIDFLHEKHRDWSYEDLIRQVAKDTGAGHSTIKKHTKNPKKIVG